MRLRHILASGPSSEPLAPPTSSEPRPNRADSSCDSWRILLLRETNDIRSATRAIGRQSIAESQVNQLVAGLPADAPRQLRTLGQITSLQRTAGQLQGLINVLAARLRSKIRRSSRPSPASLGHSRPFSVSTAAIANHITIAGILARPPFGITPVTSSS